MPYKNPHNKRERSQQLARERRAVWILAHGPCAECGSWENLEIDHIDPSTKAIKVGKVWNLGETKRAAELKKCQALCNKCHIRKTILERDQMPRGHGTTAMSRHGCKCWECCEASRIAQWKYRHPGDKREVPARRYYRSEIHPAEHGEYRKYQQGCRCKLCKMACATRTRLYRAKQVNE